MISITQENMDKMVLLDTVFSALSLEDMKNLFESDLIVSKLRGNAQDMHFFKDIMANLNSREAEIMSLQSEVTMLKNDIRDIIAAVYKPFDSNASMNFNNLKSRHGVY